MGIDITAYRGLSVSDDPKRDTWCPSYVPEGVMLNDGVLSSEKAYTYLDKFEFNEGSFSLQWWFQEDPNLYDTATHRAV